METLSLPSRDARAVHVSVARASLPSAAPASGLHVACAGAERKCDLRLTTDLDLRGLENVINDGVTAVLVPATRVELCMSRLVLGFAAINMIKPQ